MFLKNHWYVAALSSEVGRELLGRWILDKPVLLYRTEAGQAVALQGNCPHRSLPLAQGRLIGDEVQCGYHGLRFDATGTCTVLPGQVNIPAQCHLTTYPLVEKWRWLWIWMGDRERADEAKIPNFHWNDDHGWSASEGRLDIRCHYQLLVDNLLDLSHINYVHQQTIGPSVNTAEVPLKTDVQGETVSIVRRFKNVPPPLYHQRWMGWDGNMDRKQLVEWMPPSHINILSWSAPTGSAEGEETNALMYHFLNGITPATERFTYHFWLSPRNFGHDEEVSEQLQEANTHLLSQDIAILEGQQAMIDGLGGDPDMVNIPVDAGPLSARRIVASLLAEEAS